MSEIETHPLAPFLPKDATLLMLGSFPPPQHRWKMNFYYPNIQNDMWKIFGLCFFQRADYFVNPIEKTFYEDKIRQFLTMKGIAIFDTAYQVRRLKGNASDQFLEIVRPTNIKALLEQMPLCCHVMTTGDKATETLMLSMPENTAKPQIGQSVETYAYDRSLILHRMPSSSRAYPLAIEKKAAIYTEFFKKIGLLSDHV